MQSASRIFRPKFWPTAITVALVCVLLSLGYWQLQRLAWKTALIADIEARMTAEPVPLPLRVDNPDEWRYRRVVMTGRFTGLPLFLLKPRTEKGVDGFHMVEPFRSDTGVTVLVNRGWISKETFPWATRPVRRVRVEGIVQVPERNRFTPENNPAKDDWYWADVPEMLKKVGDRRMLPLLVAVPPKNDGTYPLGVNITANLRNNHRQYALFWFALAGALVIVYVISQFRRPEARG